MSPTQARRVVIGALVVGAVLALARKVTDGEMPSPRIIVGAFVAAVILLAIADTAPTVAAGIATTSLIGGTIAAGPDAIEAFTTYLSKEA